MGFPEMPLDPPLFGELSKDDLGQLAWDKHVVDSMAHAIVTPRMKREWREELDAAAKRGYRRTDAERTASKVKD